MAKRAFSTLFRASVVGSSIILLPVAVVIWLVTVPSDRRLVVLHLFTCFWSSLRTWFNPAWSVTAEGREEILPDIPDVMVANHLSILDILVLFRLFRHFTWVPEIESFTVPCGGWNMSPNRYIKLRRGDPESAVVADGSARRQGDVATKPRSGVDDPLP